jgi:hypothetical protein
VDFNTKPNHCGTDTYRQQVWPLLLQPPHAPIVRTTTTCHRVTKTHHPDSPATKHEKDNSRMKHENGTVPSNSKQQPITPPVSPCSVLIPIQQQQQPDTIHQQGGTPQQNYNYEEDNDTTIMWYDVQRWYPPTYNTTTTNTTTAMLRASSLSEDRMVLFHVMDESLSSRINPIQSLSASSPMFEESTQQQQRGRRSKRYYQGYHILVGQVLSTFRTSTTTAMSRIDDNANNDGDSSSPNQFVPHAVTNTTIAFMQQCMTTIPFLSDLVQEESLETIVEQIRQYIVPLYSYFTYCEKKTRNSTEDSIENCSYTYDNDDDDDMEQFIIGQCIPWILTLFGSTPMIQKESHPTQRKNCCCHARYLDAILASHPRYFILYLCVSKLLRLSHHQQRRSSTVLVVQPYQSSNWCTTTTTKTKEYGLNDDIDECEYIISQAIHMMKQIPPTHALNDVIQWYQSNQEEVSLSNDPDVMKKDRDTNSNSQTSKRSYYYSSSSVQYLYDMQSIITNISSLYTFACHCMTATAWTLFHMIQYWYISYQYSDAMTASAATMDEIVGHGYYKRYRRIVRNCNSIRTNVRKRLLTVLAHRTRRTYIKGRCKSILLTMTMMWVARLFLARCAVSNRTPSLSMTTSMKVPLREFNLRLYEMTPTNATNMNGDDGSHNMKCTTETTRPFLTLYKVGEV